MTRLARAHVVYLLLSAVAVAGGSFACSTSGTESVRGAKAAAESKELDRNDILDDVSMTDATSMTATQVQTFLERTPYGVRSVLAGYQPKGKLASRIIADTAKEYEINPMVLLVRVQLAQNLVSRKTASDLELDRAFGCGCTDSESGASDTDDAGAKGTSSKPTSSATTCARELEGFENQARCSASTLRRAMDALAGADGATRSGWAKGKPKKTRDGIVVTPKNDATAALYGYLPWVGKLGGGKSDVGGNSAHWRLWNDFEEARSGGKNAKGGSSGDASIDGEGIDGDEQGDGGTSEPGCRVVGADDPCPSGTRCDRTDGLTGKCVAATCACGEGLFCDSSANPPRCVECTAKDTTSCRAEVEGDRCVEGKCGCVTSADCGYDRKRICDPTRGVCMDDPFPPKEPSPSAGDAGSALPTSDTPGSDTTPSPPPALPEDEYTSSSSSSSSSGSEKSKSSDDSEETLEVPKSDSGGCSAGGAGLLSRPGSSSGAALVAAAAALARYRRRRANDAPR